MSAQYSTVRIYGIYNDDYLYDYILIIIGERDKMALIAVRVYTVELDRILSFQNTILPSLYVGIRSDYYVGISLRLASLALSFLSAREMYII